MEDTARPIIRSCHIEKCIDGIALGSSTAATVGHNRVRRCRSACVKSRDHSAGIKIILCLIINKIIEEQIISIAMIVMKTKVMC